MVMEILFYRWEHTALCRKTLKDLNKSWAKFNQAADADHKSVKNTAAEQRKFATEFETAASDLEKKMETWKSAHSSCTYGPRFGASKDKKK